MAKKIITKRDIVKAEKILARLDAPVREHLLNQQGLIEEYRARCEWKLETTFEERQWGGLAMLVTMGLITEDEDNLLARYFINKAGDYAIAKMTGKTA